MITIIGRRLIIPDCDRLLGTVSEANTRIKIKLSDETVEKFFPNGVTAKDVNVTLVMETEKGEDFPSIAFVWSNDNGIHEGYVNLVNKSYTGIINARALLTYGSDDGVTVSMQTEADHFYVTDDIDGSDVNVGGSQFGAWNALLSDIQAETDKINGLVVSVSDSVGIASGYADDAGESAKEANEKLVETKAVAKGVEGVLTMASEYASEASRATDNALARANEAKGYSEKAKTEYEGAVAYASHASQFKNEAKSFAENAESKAMLAERAKKDAETARDEAISAKQVATNKASEAVSAKVETVNAMAEAKSAINEAKEYASASKNSADMAKLAKDDVLAVVGDIDEALDGIIALMEEYAPMVNLMPDGEEPIV